MFYFLSNRSSLWPSCRKQHLKQYPTCSACGSKSKLEVHHIEPFHVNSARELDPSNLITLCSKCHLVFGHLMDYPSWNTNVEEDAKVYYNKVKNRPYNIQIQNDNKTVAIYNLVIRWYRSIFWYYRP